MFVLFSLVLTALAVADSPPVLQALGKFDTRAIPEASGLVKSRRYPGIFWVHNDSGNLPYLFAIRRDGTIVRQFRLAVPNVDWEDIAADDRGHLYLGDIGNNFGLLAIRAIYRIDEPDPDRPPSGPIPAKSTVYFKLPGKDRFDAEGLFVEAGTAFVVSKRRDGREAELFAVPLEPPAPMQDPALLRRVGALPGFVEPATGASLSEDGELLAVCSYAVLRVYRKGQDRAWGMIAEVRYEPSSVEGVAWDRLDLILASEGRGLDRVSEAAWRRGARGTRPAERASKARAASARRER
jgi:hypothetical protein